MNTHDKYELPEHWQAFQYNDGWGSWEQVIPSAANEPRVVKAYTADQVVAAIEAYRKRITELESQLEGVLSERDAHHDMADQLSEQIAAITGQEIGEHSSGNDPWQNAMLAADEWIAEDLRKLTDGSDRKRRGEPVAWIRKNGFRFISEIEPQDDSEVPLYATPQPADPIVSDVEAIVHLLESREWAEHVATTPLGQRLETAVTVLVGECPQPAETFTHRCANCNSVYQGYGCPSCRLAAPLPAESVKVDAKASVPSKDEIRAIMIKHGYTVKPGHDDLKPYVYAAAQELIETYAANDQRWRKARTLPRSWWRDAFNRIAAEGVTIDALIDAETKRRLP